MDQEQSPKVIGQFLRTIVVPAGLIIVIVLLIKEIPFVLPFFEYAFSHIGTSGQVIVISIAALVTVYLSITAIQRESRIATLKLERANVEAQLAAKERELKQVEDNNARLAEEVVRDLWRRDVIQPPPFVEASRRKARFIAVLNLKGGVGKTTLTANVGATLALMNPTLKVLLVDLDFQQTLSNMCVRDEILRYARDNRFISARLLEPTLTPEEFRRLVVRVNQVGNADIITTDDRLERMDFETQAKFFLNEREDVRFRFRSIFHQPDIADGYDVVLFDCPPRLTTSTINALTTSDYVLIPTKLDERSFEAIPRTYTFIQQMRTIAQPKIVGVIANEVQYWRGSQLIKVHREALNRVRKLLQSQDPDMYLFSAMLEYDTSIAFSPSIDLVPVLSEQVREDHFRAIAEELRQRIGK